jgi:hypothetical protein
VISLHSRRKLLPANERQPPSVAIYGQLLSRRSKGISGPSKFSTPCSIRPAGRCTCRRSGPAMRKSPRSRCANKPPARRFCLICSTPNASIAMNAARTAWSAKPGYGRRFDFTANPNATPEVINLPDRGLRHREKSPPIGIGTEVAEAGMKVRYTTTANLANELFRGRRRSPAHPGALPLQQDRPVLSRRVTSSWTMPSEFFTDREGRSLSWVNASTRLKSSTRLAGTGRGVATVLIQCLPR